MTRRAKGLYCGVYSFDHIYIDDNEDILGGLVVYTSKEDEGAGTYEIPLEAFTALKRPKKIKVTDYVEAVD